METTNNIKESILFIAIVALLVGVNIFWVEKNYDLSSEPKNSVEEKIEYVKLAGKTIKVELALTLEEQSRGLSEREGLVEDEGMLFIFSDSAQHLFWMKDMNFPIDIIWIGEDGRVVHIQESASPDSFPQVFKPDQPARYVLEVRAGFAEKNNLKISDGVEFAF